MATRVIHNPTAVKALMEGPKVALMLASVGDDIADDARAAAPAASGAGAASIRRELVKTSSGWAVHVSWDSDHFYMMFHETGTSRVPARPFLRPAARKRRTVSF